MQVTTIGLELAKRDFRSTVYAAGGVLIRKALPRAQGCRSSPNCRRALSALRRAALRIIGRAS